MSGIDAERNAARIAGKAQKKFEDYQRHINSARTPTLFAGSTGIDFSTYDLQAPVKCFESNAIQTVVEGFTKFNPDGEWTLEKIARFLGVGGFAPIAVGSPQTLADAMTRWSEGGDIDGFKLIYSVSPGDMTDIVDHFVPEL